MARGVAVRIIGIAPTSRGFAFALTEGPRRLVRWGRRRVPVSRETMEKALKNVLAESHVLFVSFDDSRPSTLSERGRTLQASIRRAAEETGVMVLEVRVSLIDGAEPGSIPSKFGIASVVADEFPHLAHFLPPRRKAWEPEDERMGLFMALAAACCAWQGFRRPR